MELITIVPTAKEAVDLILPIINEKKVQKAYKVKGEKNTYVYDFDTCRIRQVGIIGPSGDIEVFWYFVYWKEAGDL